MLGNLIISVVAGTVVGISLWILGVPYALALAVLMGVFDLVPLVGATVGALAAIGVAFATQGVTAGIVMIVVNVVYQQIENHILQPIVYRQHGAALGVPGARRRADRRRAPGRAGRADRDPGRRLDPARSSASFGRRVDVHRQPPPAPEPEPEPPAPSSRCSLAQQVPGRSTCSAVVAAFPIATRMA